MMHKLLHIEEGNYISNLNAEGLRKQLEDFFTQGNGGVEGKLTTNDEFTANDKLNVIGWHMPNFKRKAAYLKGKIIQREKGSLIQLKAQPNSVLPLFALLSILIGILLIGVTIINTHYDTFTLLIGSVFIAVGLIYYPLSNFFKNRLRNKFVNSLALDKV